MLIEGQIFTVIGVSEPQKQALGSGANPEDNIVIMPLSTMRKLHPEFKDFVLFIKANDGWRSAASGGRSARVACAGNATCLRTSRTISRSSRRIRSLTCGSRFRAEFLW